MLINLSRVSLVVTVISLAVASQACGLPPRRASITTGSGSQVQSSVAASPTATLSIVENNTLTPVATPTVGATASPTTTLVTVTAAEGKLSIRSGPDIKFDAIAVLENGETVTALARSIIDGWVEIRIPSQPSKMGWVSTMTAHSIVIGNILDLPRIDEVDWPVGSYILNCTQHRLIVKPGEQVVQPASVTTQNRVWFAPGLYSIYDLDMSGQPLVLNLNIRAHGQVTVHRDGSHQWSECP